MTRVEATRSPRRRGAGAPVGRPVTSAASRSSRAAGRRAVAGGVRTTVIASRSTSRGSRPTHPAVLRLTEIPQIGTLAAGYTSIATPRRRPTSNVVVALKARARGGTRLGRRCISKPPDEVDRQANARLGRRDDLRLEYCGHVTAPASPCESTVVEPRASMALEGVNAVLPVCGSRVGVDWSRPRQQQGLRGPVESFLSVPATSGPAATIRSPRTATAGSVQARGGAEEPSGPDESDRSHMPVQSFLYSLPIFVGGVAIQMEW